MKLSPEKLRILRELDVDAALKNVAQKGFIPDTREIALAGLHRARITLGRVFTKKEREISRTWLKANGYNPGEPNYDRDHAED